LGKQTQARANLIEELFQCQWIEFVDGMACEVRCHRLARGRRSGCRLIQADDEGHEIAQGVVVEVEIEVEVEFPTH